MSLNRWKSIRVVMTLIGAIGVMTAALSGSLLRGAELPQAAGANQRDDAIVMLAYDSGTETLLKASTVAVYRSSDHGQSWQKLDTPPPGDGRIAAISTSAATKGVIYIAGPGLGVHRTGDGGKTWVERDEGLASRDVVAIAAHTTQPDTVYAGVASQGVYRSQDAGKTWRFMDRGPREGIRQLIHSDMPGSMQTGWLFAATPQGVRRIMDCFCLWEEAGKLASDTLSVAYDPKQPAHLYAIAKKGLFRSPDGGQT